VKRNKKPKSCDFKFQKFGMNCNEMTLTQIIGIMYLMCFIFHSTWGTPRQLKMLMCENKQELEPEPCYEKESSKAGVRLMKTKSARAGAMFMKRRALELEQCHFTMAPQPWLSTRICDYPYQTNISKFAI